MKKNPARFDSKSMLLSLAVALHDAMALAIVHYAMAGILV